MNQFCYSTLATSPHVGAPFRVRTLLGREWFCRMLMHVWGVSASTIALH